MKAATVIDDLTLLKNAEKAIHNQRFFKTGKGEYAEGDQFFGISNPDVRMVAKKYKELPLTEARILVKHPIHEIRFAGLLILISHYRKNKSRRREIVDCYLAHTAYINNWDLVDITAPHILGDYLLFNPDQRDLLYRLAESSDLWEQRIAVISSLGMVRKGELDDAVRLCEKLLFHPHDLMHKAVGWTLREIGKKNRAVLIGFLDRYADRMPRTALRYAIEHFDEKERKEYMSRKKK